MFGFRVLSFWLWTDAGGEPEPEPEPEQSPVVIPGGVGRSRKRRILPDGRRIFATEQEAIDALLIYYYEQKLKPKEAAVLGLEHKRTRKVIVLPSERIEILEALETLRLAEYDHNLQAKRRQEEEWLILFH